MGALDGMLLEHLADKLFTPERMRVILQAAVSRSAEAMDERRRRLGQARARESDIKGEQARLVKLVTKGLMSEDDPVFREEFGALKRQRRAVADEIKTLDAMGAASGQEITAEKIERLAQLLRGALQSDDPALRKAYVQMFVGSVIVGDDTVEVSGPTSALIKASERAVLPLAADVVPGFVREWRPRRDSNPRPPD